MINAAAQIIADLILSFIAFLFLWAAVSIAHHYLKLANDRVQGWYQRVLVDARDRSEQARYERTRGVTR